MRTAWRQRTVGQFISAATDAKAKGLIRGLKVANAPWSAGLSRLPTRTRGASLHWLGS